MVKACCVPLCRSNIRTVSKDVTFHCFPKDDVRKNKWLQRMRRDEFKNFTGNRSKYVCSLHFTTSDFVIPQGQLRHRLKLDSVPSIFEWTNPSTDSQNNVYNNFNFKVETVTPSVSNFGEHNYSEKPSFIIQKTSDDSTLYFNSELDSFPEEESQKSRIERFLQLTNNEKPPDDSTSSVISESGECAEEHTERLKTETMLQLRDNKTFCLLRFINEDEKIKYYTGFKSFQALYAFYNFLMPECPILNDDDVQQLPPVEELFLTLIRLRKALPEQVLADLYNISEALVSNIFITWVSFLSDRLLQLPIWPSKLMIQNTMPQCFKDSYPNTRLIVDCTKLYVEHCSDNTAQKETFSGNKDQITVKGVIGIAPNGQITYASRLYAGHVSDNILITHCGLLDKLEEGDSVMVEEAFELCEALKDKDISLIIPAFLKNQHQVDENELDENCNIANVGVHVERAFCRIKEFRILSGVIPSTLCPNLDKIWLCCVYLANFTE